MRVTMIALLIANAALVSTSANAEITKCETSKKNHAFVPGKIEFELNDRGTSADVLDTVSQKFGYGWVSSTSVTKNAKRITIAWTSGPIPENDDWWGSGSIFFRLTKLTDGTFRISGRPDRAKEQNVIYEGSGRCR